MKRKSLLELQQEKFDTIQRLHKKCRWIGFGEISDNELKFWSELSEFNNKPLHFEDVSFFLNSRSISEYW